MNSCSELQGWCQLFQRKAWSCWPACLGLEQIIFFYLYFSRQKCSWEGKGPRKDPGMFSPLLLSTLTLQPLQPQEWMAPAFWCLSLEVLLSHSAMSTTTTSRDVLVFNTRAKKLWRKITMEAGGNNPCKANVKERNNLLLCFNEEKVKTFEIPSFQRHSCKVIAAIPVSLTQHLLKVPSADSHESLLELSLVTTQRCACSSRRPDEVWGQLWLTWADAQTAEQPSSALYCPSANGVITLDLTNQFWGLIRKIHTRLTLKVKPKG